MSREYFNKLQQDNLDKERYKTEKKEKLIADKKIEEIKKKHKLNEAKLNSQIITEHFSKSQ